MMNCRHETITIMMTRWRWRNLSVCRIIIIFLYKKWRLWSFLGKVRLRKRPTFRDATAGFPAKWCLRNERSNSILMNASSLVDLNFPCGTTNQKRYPDQRSDTSSVWNFCAFFSMSFLTSFHFFCLREMSAVSQASKGNINYFVFLQKPPSPVQVKVKVNHSPTFSNGHGSEWAQKGAKVADSVVEACPLLLGGKTGLKLESKHHHRKTAKLLCEETFPCPRTLVQPVATNPV